MLTVDKLLNKCDDFLEFSQKDQVAHMSYFYCQINSCDSFSPKKIQQLFVDNNLTAPSNISREFNNLLKEKPQRVIKKDALYGLQRGFKNILDTRFFENSEKKMVSLKLHHLIDEVNTTEQKVFLKEAVECFELKAYRASIIMTWLLTIHVLLNHTIKNCLREFNLELSKRNNKYVVKDFTDFENFKESLILEILRNSNVITKEQKKLLEEKLSIRNSAAHPNSTLFKESKVITYIEELIDEIVIKFK